MRACAVNRKAGHVERGSQKPNEDCRDGYQKLGAPYRFAARFGWYGWRDDGKNFLSV